MHRYIHMYIYIYSVGAVVGIRARGGIKNVEKQYRKGKETGVQRCPKVTRNQ